MAHANNCEDQILRVHFYIFAFSISFKHNSGIYEMSNTMNRQLSSIITANFQTIK